MAATITGIVFNDLNHNGQYNIGEPGIAGVFVILSNAAGCVPAQTGDDGNYSFTVTAAGAYTVYEIVADPGSTCPPAEFTQPDGFTMSNGPRKLSVTVTAAQVNNGATIASQNFSHDTVSAAMVCGTTMYQFVGRPTSWYNIDIVTGASTLYGALSPAGEVNAIGYNILDNYIYGYNQTSNTIVRVDNSRNLITLYPTPTGLPANGFNVGTFDLSGFFYIFVNNTARFYTVDLRPNASTFMKLVNPANGYAEQTANYGTALSTTINVSDWVYNTVDGYLYGIERNGVVERIDPLTGRVTALATTGPNPNASFGAIAIDAANTIYAISNGDGSVYKYTISGNTARGVYFSATYFASFNDATMCPTAVLQVDYGDAPDLGAGNGPGNYNTLLAQNGPRHELISELYLGARVTAEPDAYQNIDASGDDIPLGVQDDGMNLPLPALSPSAGFYTLDALVTNHTGITAYLYGWVDFDQNGLFELSEAASVQTVPPATEVQTIPLTFTVPTGVSLQPGHTFARLRLTTLALTGSDATVQDLRSVGPAPDGEVEDYILTVGPIADLAVYKTANLQDVAAGDQLMYTIKIVNNGPDPAESPLLQDSIPAELENPRFSVDGGGSWQAWTGSYTLPSLAVNSTTEVLIMGDISQYASGTVINTANVTSETEDPDLSNNTSSAITPIAQSADLAVIKTASPNPAIAGGQITFSMTVTNYGPSNAEDVFLADAVSSQILNPEFSTDGGSTWADWTSPYRLGELALGDTVTVLIRGTVVSSASGTIPNTAVVASLTPDPNPENNTSNVNVPVEALADLAVVKLGNPQSVSAGDQLNYLISVTNAGPSDAQNVTLSDSMPGTLGSVEFSVDGGATWSAWSSSYSLGTVANGGTVLIVMHGIVTSAALGQIVNTATVDSSTPDPDPANNTSTANTPVVTAADLVITKTADANPVQAGNVLTYTLTVANNGPSDAQSVTVSDAVPAGIVTPQFSVDGGIVWNNWTGSAALGTFVNGAVRTLLLRGTVNPSATGTLVNTAIAGSITPDPDPENNTDTEITPINTSADLAVSKTGSPKPAIGGQYLTYTVVVTNNGPNDALDVILTDTIPSELSAVEFSIDGGGSWSVWSGSYDIGTVPNSTSYTLLIRGIVSPAASGLLKNTAVVSGTTPDPNPENNTDTDLTPVDSAADLSITKTAGSATVTAGEPLTYTLQIANAGPNDAVNAVLTDAVPDTLLDPEFSLDGGVSWQIWSDPYTIGTISSGGVLTVLLRGQVDPGADSDIVNTAVIGSDTPDPDPTNNTDSTTTPVNRSADLSVTKTGAPNPATPGEQVLYTITASNTGPSVASDAILVDIIPSGLTGVEYSADDGVTWSTWQSPYLLGDMAPGSALTVQLRGTLSSSATGTLSNTAVAGSTTPDPDPTNNRATDDLPVSPSADIFVTKRASIYPAVAGMPEIFVLLVSNAGPSDAENVVLTDALPTVLSGVEYSVDAGNTWLVWTGTYAIGTLAACDTKAILIHGTVDGGAADSLENTANVDSTTPDPDPTNNTDTVEVPIIQMADLAVTKTAAGDEAVVGEMLTYNISITNNGPSEAQNAVLTDTPPEFLSGAQVSLDGGLTWTGWSSPYLLGNIASDAVINLLVRGTILPTGNASIANTATVGSDSPDPDPTNNTDTEIIPVVSRADLSIQKLADSTPVSFGDYATYRMVIRNNGPSPAQEVTLYDVLPQGLTNGQFSTDDGATWQVWNNPYVLGDMDRGAVRIILLRGVADNTAGNIISNTGTVESSTPDPDPTNNTDTADIPVARPMYRYKRRSA